jgi:hypothetical protein
MPPPRTPNLQKPHKTDNKAHTADKMPLTDKDKKLCCKALELLNTAIVDGLMQGSDIEEGAKTVGSTGAGLDQIGVAGYALQAAENPTEMNPAQWNFRSLSSGSAKNSASGKPSANRSNIAGARTSEFETWANAANAFRMNLDFKLRDPRGPEIPRKKVTELLRIIQLGINCSHNIKTGLFNRGKTRARVTALLIKAQEITNSVLTKTEARAKESEEDKRSLEQWRSKGLQAAVENRTLNPETEKAEFKNTSVSSEED